MRGLQCNCPKCVEIRSRVKRLTDGTAIVHLPFDLLHDYTEDGMEYARHAGAAWANAREEAVLNAILGKDAA